MHEVLSDDYIKATVQKITKAHYDSAAHFFHELAEQLMQDSNDDVGKGHPRLATDLSIASELAGDMSDCFEEAWEICKKHEVKLVKDPYALRPGMMIRGNLTGAPKARLDAIANNNCHMYWAGYSNASLVIFHFDDISTHGVEVLS